MKSHRMLVLSAALFSLGLLAAAPARAASLVQVARATWLGGATVPSYMQMYIYVPDRVAAKPPIYISCHSCGSTATGQISNIPMAKAQADAQGFILILPDNPGNNCWDVGTANSLKHDGGGDTHALAQMIRYTIKQYNADPDRVYIMGGSGGAMYAQAMAAVYPDLIRAAVARAGVAAGCWADGYASSNQWSNTCAAGSVNKTAQQWGDLVRNMYPGYTGHRPRIQLYHGDNDSTINYKNMGESIEEWTNVLGLPMTPTSTDTGYMAASAKFNRQFWKNSCGQNVLEAWTAPGATHSMTYEELEMLKFFGLNAANTPDPENCGGSGGAGGGGTGGGGGAGGGAGGATGAGGRGGAGGAAGVSGGGGVQARGGSGGAGGSGPGTGGSGTGAGGSTAGSGGSGTGAGGSGTGSGGSGTGAGGSTAGGAGTTPTGGSVGSGGSGTGTGGSGTGSGGSTGTGNTAGTSPTGGTTGAGGDTMPPGETDPAGCACAIGSHDGQSAFVTPLLLAALGLIVRRRRRTRG